MYLNKCKGLIFVLSLIQNVFFLIYEELFTLVHCAASQSGQVPGTRSLTVPEQLPQETQSVLACTGSSQSSFCNSRKDRE